MDEFQKEALKKEFGLDYHIEYAAAAEELVGFKGKRVLEVGGSLPYRLALDVLKAAQWTALEEMEYWKETLSTGHILGNPPDSNAKYKRFTEADHSDLSEYNLFSGRIEELPQALEEKFDMVFSIAAFEHIARLPLALEKMKGALVLGGKLLTIFAPLWSCWNGHHLPEVVDKAGNHWNFGNSPIPPWGHLLYKPAELFDLLCQKSDVDTAWEIVYFTYCSPHINRYFFDDYVDIVVRSGFKIHMAIPPFGAPEIPVAVSQQLLARYPGRTNFGDTGLLFLLERTI